MIALTTLFTSLFGGITLLFDKNWGLMRELLASPMPRNHIILGIGLSGVTKSFIQVMVIMGFGLLIGVRFFPGYTLMQTVGAVLGVLLFVGVFSLGFLFLSSAISMSMDTPEGLQAVITLLTLPLFFASNALYPIDAFPGVVRTLSQFNPLTHLVNGVRYFAVGRRLLRHRHSLCLQQQRRHALLSGSDGLCRGHVPGGLAGLQERSGDLKI